MQRSVKNWGALFDCFRFLQHPSERPNNCLVLSSLLVVLLLQSLPALFITLFSSVCGLLMRPRHEKSLSLSA